MWPILTRPGSGFERLAAALEALCGLAEESMPLLLALDGEANASVFHEGEGDEEAMTRTPFTEPLERLLVDGVADESLRCSDPAESATVLFNMVGWTYIHLRSGHHWSAERSSRAVLKPVLDGLRAS